MLSLDVGGCSPFSAALVLYKACGGLLTNRRLFLNLVFCPNAKLQDVLKFLGQVVPPVVIAQCVSRQIVLFNMSATAAVGPYVISLPLCINLAPADVAPTVCLSEYSFALVRG